MHLGTTGKRTGTTETYCDWRQCRLSELQVGDCTGPLCHHASAELASVQVSVVWVSLFVTVCHELHIRCRTMHCPEKLVAKSTTASLRARCSRRVNSREPFARFQRKKELSP